MHNIQIRDMRRGTGLCCRSYPGFLGPETCMRRYTLPRGEVCRCGAQAGACNGGTSPEAPGAARSMLIEPLMTAINRRVATASTSRYRHTWLHET